MAPNRVVKVPTVLQMEAAECGAASLAMVLAHYDLFVPLEKLREDCGVSRDGSKASNVLRAARAYGMEAKGYKREVERIKDGELPVIIHWNFNHFLVVEGYRKGRFYLNDPARGRRSVSEAEFGDCFTGVTLVIQPGPEFKPGGERPSVLRAVRQRLVGAETAVLFLLLTSLAMVLPGLVVPTLSRIFVDDILIGGKSDWLRPLLLGLVFTALLRGAVTYLKGVYLLRLFTKLSVVSSARFFWHVLRLPVPFFLARYAGDIGARVRLNDDIAQVLSRRIAQGGLDVLLILFYGTLLLSYDVTLTLAGVAITALNILMMRALSERRHEDSMRLQQESGKLVGVAMGGLQLVETLKAGGMESDFYAKWSGHWAKLQNSAQDLGRSSLWFSTTPAFLSTLNSVLILGLGGLKVMEGDLTVGMLVAYQSLMASFVDPVNSLVNLGSTFQETGANLSRLDDVFNHRRDDHLEPSPATREDLPDKLAGYVNLKSLTFGYAPFSPPLIEDFSLDLEPGKRVALIGGSGSGKSTVARVVAGLYAPWKGEILFDGAPRRDIPRATFTNSVAMVDQDIFLFEGSIRENLTLWDPSIPDADIVQACKDAHIHDDVASRPGGYNGKVEEGGRNFSGGQRQRLEIARALVRNPTILLLDEATSALDAKSEKIIDDNLRRRGCTCIIIAHRLSTIRDADEIIVLDGGKVVQRGTHADMIKDPSAPYAQLMAAT